MPIDPSIYARNNPLNIAQAIQGWQNVDLNSQQLAAGKLLAQKNALAMQQEQQAMQDAQQIRNALAGLGQEATDEDYAKAALGTRLPGGIKLADEIRKNAAERAFKAAQTRREGAQQAKDEEETAAKRSGLYKDMLASVSDKPTAAIWVQAQYKDPVMSKIVGAIPMEQALSRIPDDPQQFMQWRNAQGMGLDKFIQDQTTRARDAATAAGAQATREETARMHRKAEEDRAASRAQAERHFQARRQDDKKKSGIDQPLVAVLDEKGNAVYAPLSDAVGKTPANLGNELSPKDRQKREALYPAATQRIKGFYQTSDTLIKDLKTLKSHKGLDSITGIVAGRVPGITAEGRAAEALYNKIIARGGFQELADMRASSPTGGALGNVSDREGKQLRDAWGALSRTQNANDLRLAIDDAIAKVEAAKTNVRDAYDLTYEYRGEKAQSNQRPPIESFGR